MTLDEAIKRAEEVAELNEWFDKNCLESIQCKECAKEHRQLAEWLKELKEFREQQTCGDCISRQAVLEQTYNWSKDEFLRVTMPFDYLRKRINSLPSVKQEYTNKIILTIHKTIAQFLDHENKLTDRDHFLLDVNQAICTNIRLLESKDK